MSAALRPDDAPDEAAGCAHADVHWHPAKVCAGTPDGPGDGTYAAQGGVCRACRRPVLRTKGFEWGPTEAVSGADPVPRRRYDGPGGGPYGRRHG